MLYASVFTTSLRVVLLAGAVALASGATASAQEYDRYGQPVYHDNGPPDEITVFAPRHHHQERSAIGAPIEDVSLSTAVRYDDLDLTTDWGIRRLHDRISSAAHDLCQRLDVTHPIAVSDSPPCYRTAMEEAEPLAVAAIDRANEQASNAPSDDPRYQSYDETTTTTYYRDPR
jgi:UrcA family protein